MWRNMFMDIFVEQIVKKKMESKEKIMAVGIAVAAVVVCFFVFPVFDGVYPSSGGGRYFWRLLAYHQYEPGI